jgi:hypothetical protein
MSKTAACQLVGWRDEGGVGGVSFERRNRWKDRRVVKKGSRGWGDLRKMRPGLH